MSSCANTTPREHKQPISISIAALDRATPGAPSQLQCALHPRASAEETKSLSVAVRVDFKTHLHPSTRRAHDNPRDRVGIDEAKQRYRRRCVKAPLQ
jgi:hypothetical protein